MRHFVHHKAGEIVGAHDSDAEQSIEGCETVEVSESAMAKHPRFYKVVDGKIVPKAADETEAAHAPTMVAVKRVILSELQRSDYTQLLDAPCSEAERSAWREYRATLRALYKGQDAQRALSAMPTAPDGTTLSHHMRFSRPRAAGV